MNADDGKEFTKDEAVKGEVLKDEVVINEVGKDEGTKDEFTKGDSFPVASMVLGIISIVFVFFWYMALPAGVLAIVFGNKSSRAKSGRGMGKAGLIMGIVGLSLCVFMYVSMVMGLIF